MAAGAHGPYRLRWSLVFPMARFIPPQSCLEGKREVGETYACERLLVAASAPARRLSSHARTVISLGLIIHDFCSNVQYFFGHSSMRRLSPQRPADEKRNSVLKPECFHLAELMGSRYDCADGDRFGDSSRGPCVFSGIFCKNICLAGMAFQLGSILAAHIFRGTGAR